MKALCSRGAARTVSGTLAAGVPGTRAATTSRTPPLAISRNGLETSHVSAAALYRLLVVTVLGFASGLPLALTGQAMQAWLSLSGVDIATIGFLSLVGLPYTFKFLWRL